MGLAWRDVHGKEKVYIHFSLVFVTCDCCSCILIFVTLDYLISDYHHLKRQLESELVDSITGQLAKSFLDLPKAEQQMKLKERLKKYCQKVFSPVMFSSNNNTRL